MRIALAYRAFFAKGPRARLGDAIFAALAEHVRERARSVSNRRFPVRNQDVLDRQLLKRAKQLFELWQRHPMVQPRLGAQTQPSVVVAEDAVAGYQSRGPGSQNTVSPARRNLNDSTPCGRLGLARDVEAP